MILEFLENDFQTDYRNIWYSHRPCGGCARNVSREHAYWQAEASEIAPMMQMRLQII